MHRHNGFTLIELMIAIAIVAILAGIALPSYNNYIARSKIQEGTTALLGSRIKMEQFFQDNRSYPTSCVVAPVVPGATQVQVPALQFFDITCTFPNANQYVLRATAKDSTIVGLQLELNEANQRTTRNAPTKWGVSSALPKSCWMVKTNGDC